MNVTVTAHVVDVGGCFSGRFCVLCLVAVQYWQKGSWSTKVGVGKEKDMIKRGKHCDRREIIIFSEILHGKERIELTQ